MKLLSALNDRLIVGGILCDVAEAFDYVNYVFLSKLNFLRNTCQRLRMDQIVPWE
jgi:hypothetical protein